MVIEVQDWLLIGTLENLSLSVNYLIRPSDRLSRYKKKKFKLVINTRETTMQ